MIVNKDRSGKSGIKQLSESAKECVEKHHTLFFEEGVLNIPIYREYRRLRSTSPSRRLS